jgi:Zn-finger nucleic acid-binding protein
MDSQTRTLKCPNCGGEAQPDSVRCEWCGSSLATVSCPSCFGAMFIGMKHCPWCGVEAARLELPGSAGPCPRCNVTMLAVKVGRTSLNECRQCGGLWVDNASFQQICEDRESQEAVLGVARSSAEHADAKLSAQSRMYVPCPLCRQLMNRVNFAGCSGVVIDWCKEHGTWFDHSELRRVVEFIQAGGLKKSREREKIRLEEENRRLRHKELSLMADRDHAAGSSGILSPWRQDESSFLEFLSAVWRGLG